MRAHEIAGTPWLAVRHQALRCVPGAILCRRLEPPPCTAVVRAAPVPVKRSTHAAIGGSGRASGPQTGGPARFLAGNVLGGDLAEGVALLGSRRKLLFALVLGRVSAFRQHLLGTVPPAPRVGERGRRIGTKLEKLLPAAESVLQPPEFGAIRLHQKMQPAAVSELERLLARLRIADRELGKRHGGIAARASR